MIERYFFKTILILTWCIFVGHHQGTRPTLRRINGIYIIELNNNTWRYLTRTFSERRSVHTLLPGRQMKKVTNLIGFGHLWVWRMLILMTNIQSARRRHVSSLPDEKSAFVIHFFIFKNVYSLRDFYVMRHHISICIICQLWFAWPFEKYISIFYIYKSFLKYLNTIATRETDWKLYEIFSKQPFILKNYELQPNLIRSFINNFH